MIIKEMILANINELKILKIRKKQENNIIIGDLPGFDMNNE